MCNHFLYRHIRQDKNQPFYIGIGTKKKWFTDFETEYRRAFEKTNRTTYWKNITNKTNYKVEILFESDDYNFIKQKEIEFIALYGRYDLGKGTLTNLTDGGEGTLGMIISKETRKRMSISGKGKVRNGVVIYQYDLFGKFIKEWPNMRTTERELGLVIGSIGKCFKGTYKQTGDSFWSKEKLDYFINPYVKKSKKVYQYNLEGNFIKEWDSTQSAATYYNCCRGTINQCTIKTSYSGVGFIWSYEKKTKIIPRKKESNRKKIYQYNLDDNFIKEWGSLREIYNELFSDKIFKNLKKYILCSTSGIRNSAYGFKWKYELL